MKKRFAIVNLSLTFAVLFSMLFQSVHSIEHFASELHEKNCVHKLESKHEFTHKHHDTDHCLVCDFSFSGYVAAEFVTIGYYPPQGHIPYFSSNAQNFRDFQGNSSLLRGPPSYMI